ncbi:MAG TPA: hypothetical protein PKL74_08385 [Tenuifilaceae bacterium]|jgi:hypothetical protein|nr:hypothetical protein [Bacteroidales bacterium]HOC37069.1 hypothetical protein [Tenuifilaceae bacterium]HPW26561.1 hypothetical protein [Tenuifilaceae bacterium]
MRKVILITVAAALVILPLVGFGQEVNANFFSTREDSLSKLLSLIVSETSTTRRDSLNRIFHENFKNTLEHDGAIDYPFSSLKHVGMLTSSDQKVRIITWNIPQTGGYHRYFGFVLVRLDGDKSRLYALTDSREMVKDPQHERLPADRWLGALYYQLAELPYGSEKQYVLLGFDYNNLFTSKKVIEVLTLSPQGEPVFGLPVFNVDNKQLLSRIVFEFSARAGFNLKYYDEQKIIAFDHLSPSQPEFTGDFQFYGPDASIDGFAFENGKWVYVRDLDMRNPSREKVNPVDAPEKIDEPSFLYKPQQKRK